jgi:tetratricopeptide (TPR) repeat protein
VDAHDPDALDAHPIVRAYFAGLLERIAPEATKATHEKLFRHYAAAAPDLPETLRDMTPLFHAVGHGVKAGCVREAFKDIYLARLRQGDSYIFQILGAYGAALATLAQFFEMPWSQVHPALPKEYKVDVLGDASFALRGLGRLKESAAPREAAIAEAIANEKWEEAASLGESLSSTYLHLGDIARAISVAERAVQHADKAGIEFRNECSLTVLANALLAANELDRAGSLFAKAERLTALEQLFSLRGYQYGDLVLFRGDAEEALRRGHFQINNLDRVAPSLLTAGLAWLLVGRAEDALGRSEASASIDKAVEGMRKAASMPFLIQALFARADHRRKRIVLGETALIQHLQLDLAEIADAVGSEMRLYMVDLALERAWFAIDVSSVCDAPEEEATRQVNIASQLIAETGYQRRATELSQLRSRLAAFGSHRAAT